MYPAAAVPRLLPGLVEVYRAVFAGPPHHEGAAEVERFRDVQLPSHLDRHHFTLAVATEADRLVGFVYGYTGHRGHYWSDLVVRTVPRAVSDHWIGGHFELVTLAVAPRVQNRGVGTRLMTEVLDAVPHDRALLTGPTVDSPARRLYRRLGWTDLAPVNDSTLFELSRQPAATAGSRRDEPGPAA